MRHPGRLVLVKHSLVIPVAGEPPSTWVLSSEGQRRAATLGARLRGVAATRIWSSDEPKAAETAAIAGRVLGLPVLTDPALREQDRDRAPFLASERAFREAVRGVFDRPDAAVFGTESAAAALARFGAAVDRAAAAEPRDAVVVAHGTVIALYAASRAGADGYALWERLGLPSYVVLAGGAVAEVVPEVRDNDGGG